MIEVDVVVIGAGLSGLSAAYELRKRDEGLQVAIIEAKGTAYSVPVHSPLPVSVTSGACLLAVLGARLGLGSWVV